MKPARSIGDVKETHVASDFLVTLDALGIGTFTIDHVRGTIAACDDTFAHMFGYEDAAAMLGVSVQDHYADPRERDEATVRIYGHPDLKRDGYIRFEAQRTRRDGTPIDVLMSLVPTFGRDGTVTIVSGVAERLDKRLNAERAFRSSEERFRVLFDSSAVGMALATPTGTIVRVNHAFCNFLSCSEAKLVGRQLIDLVEPELRAEAEAQLSVLPDVGAGMPPPSGGAEWRFQRADGEPVWGQVSNSWLADDGVPHTRVLIVQDTTRRKQAEAVVARVEKLEAVGLLAGGIAHDFNNLLTVMLGNIELALDDSGLAPSVRNALDQAQLSGRRARDLTKQLITFARGGGPVKKAVSVVQIAEETAEFCLCGTRSRAVFNQDADLHAVEVDPGQIGQVFQNLLLNAAEAMPAGGAIRLHFANAAIGVGAHPTLPPGSYVRIEVQDAGAGIPDKIVSRIFDPYFSTKARGSGLGLATVQSIVRRHGGDVDVHSRPGQGTRFGLYLPATAQAPAGQPNVPDAPQPALGALRVLVMDDEHSVCDVAQASLQREGHLVSTTPDGQQAVAEFARALRAGQPYDIVILDLTVRGGMGGVEALRHLRALDPTVRAIVSSGYNDDPVMANCRAAGFHGVVPKPFTFAELCGAVRSVMANENG